MKRSYRQNCALALSNDILGERWTLLIIRELLIQPCRFKDLNSVLIGMGTNLLTSRLKELEAFGLIERQSTGDKRSPYQLSPRGLEVEPIVLAIIRWGNGTLAGESDYSHQDHWDLLAMKALYQPELLKTDKEKTSIALTNIRVVFKTDDFHGWVNANANGLTFGLDTYLAASGMEADENEERVIELPMTIAQLQQIFKEDKIGKKETAEKNELLKTHQGLADFIGCFAKKS